MTRPNVLLLFADDQRFDTIGALGNPHVHTPALDALARRGTAMTHCHIMGGSVPAVCMPSRAMLHTGRALPRLHDHGREIPDDDVLLGECFRRAGHATFGTGKWHNGSRAYARSFTGGGEIFFGGMNDHWNVPACDFRPDGDYPEPVPYRFIADGREFRPRQVYDHVHSGRHSSELFADAAVNFLRDRPDGQPFFAYVSFMAPHDPRVMPAEFLNLYDPDKLPTPESFMPEHPFDNGELRIRDELLAPWPRTPEIIRRHLADYYAMISHLDAQVARVLAALDATGEADRTIVAYAADNGLAVGRHGLMGKQNLYDHSLRVPLILAGPGIPAGERRDALCYLHDLFPTLCDLANLDTPPDLDARTLVPTLGRGAAAHREHLTFHYRHFQRAVRRGNLKLIDYSVTAPDAPQLFDLAADPYELRNLAPTRPDLVSSLRPLLPPPLPSPP